uniref:Tegument protein n=1 Tax=Human cytomegalovirus TaxID=10359 RepID=TEGU_HCMV|nr:RecName: Full=Tegument protein; AltName: Full=67 kDa phosphorylated protein [Human betaherpesvirus 5]AAA45986.1 67-kDa phosphorylated tegument protein [Human betaherpesvirus 5]
MCRIRTFRLRRKRRVSGRSFCRSRIDPGYVRERPYIGGRSRPTTFHLTRKKKAPLGGDLSPSFARSPVLEPSSPPQALSVPSLSSEKKTASPTCVKHHLSGGAVRRANTVVPRTKKRTSRHHTLMSTTCRCWSSSIVLYEHLDARVSDVGKTSRRRRCSLGGTLSGSIISIVAKRDCDYDEPHHLFFMLLLYKRLMSTTLGISHLVKHARFSSLQGTLGSLKGTVYRPKQKTHTCNRSTTSNDTKTQSYNALFMERTWNKKTIAARAKPKPSGEAGASFPTQSLGSLSSFFFPDSLKNHRHSPMTRNQLLEHKRSQQVETNKLDDAITLYCVYIDRCEFVGKKRRCMMHNDRETGDCSSLPNANTQTHRFPSPHKEMRPPPTNEADSCSSYDGALARRASSPLREGTSGSSAHRPKQQCLLHCHQSISCILFPPNSSPQHQFALLRKVVATAAAATGRSSSPRPQTLYMCRKCVNTCYCPMRLVHRYMFQNLLIHLRAHRLGVSSSSNWPTFSTTVVNPCTTTPIKTTSSSSPRPRNDTRSPPILGMCF